jgi:hypothetical protein
MINNNTYRLIALLASAFLICVSCGIQSHDWKGTIEEVNGVTIVRNPGEPLYGNDVYTIKEDLKIGDEGGDENFFFSFINYLAVDNKKNICVADTKEKNIKVFDSSGQFLRTIGRAGQGPGEFGRLAGIHINARNELAITDSSQRKIHYYSLEGDFLRSISLEIFLEKIQRMFHRNAWHLYFDSKENCYIRADIFVSKEVHFEILKFDNETNRLTTIARTPEWTPFEGLNPDRPAYLYCRVMKDDCFLYGYPGSYELQIFDPEGKIIKRITREYEHVPFSAQEKEEEKKAYGEDHEIPPYHPAFSYLRTDDEGRIFVRTWERPTSGDGFFYDVFDGEGKYIVQMPLNLTPQVIKSGKIYTIEEDAEGYQYVKRYRISWKY